MRVELLDSMGSDLTVANAARVSFAKQVETFGDRDAKLIRYLARHNHWTPFAHCVASFRVAAPVIVRAQLWKHVVGLSIGPEVPMNEVSRRYVDDAPTFYAPAAWRARAENVKQGSGGALPSSRQNDADGILAAACLDAEARYETLLDLGVCPEQARLVLPQALMTEWIWTGSLAAWARVCRLRLDPHAQAETRAIAEQIAEHMARLFPASWAALMGEGA